MGIGSLILPHGFQVLNIGCWAWCNTFNLPSHFISPGYFLRLPQTTGNKKANVTFITQFQKINVSFSVYLEIYISHPG